MRKYLFGYFTLILISFSHSLTSLFNSEYINSLHVNAVTEEIKNLLNRQLDPFNVYIPYMRIEASDIPVKYLTNITLQDCILSGFNFDYIDLSQINFINTKLENCNLQKAIIWEVLTYGDILYLTKHKPKKLIKIYSNLIQKSDEYYSNLNYKQQEYYHKKADRFYQTLKTINCYKIIEMLKK